MSCSQRLRCAANSPASLSISSLRVLGVGTKSLSATCSFCRACPMARVVQKCPEHVTNDTSSYQFSDATPTSTHGERCVPTMCFDQRETVTLGASACCRATITDAPLVCGRY